MTRLGSEPTFSTSAIEAFIWKDHGRFVELHPVRLGWLVVWGCHEENGQRRVLVGNRTYQEMDAARRRLGTAVADLTGQASLAAEALRLLDRSSQPDRELKPLAEPL